MYRFFAVALPASMWFFVSALYLDLKTLRVAIRFVLMRIAVAIPSEEGHASTPWLEAPVGSLSGGLQGAGLRGRWKGIIGVLCFGSFYMDE